MFNNNYVWQTKTNAYKRNPKSDTTNDVSYYQYSGATPSPIVTPTPVLGNNQQAIGLTIKYKFLLRVTTVLPRG